MYSILQVFPVFPLASISFHQPKPPKKGTNVEHLFYALELTLTSVLAIASVSHQGWLDILEHSNFYLSKSDRFLNWSWFVMVCHDLLDYNMIYIYMRIYTQCWVIHVVNMRIAPVPGHLAIPGYQHFPVRLVEMQSSNWGPDPLAKAPRGPRQNWMELAWLWMMW